MVKEFMTVFGQVMEDKPSFVPSVVMFRARLLNEELDEFMAACRDYEKEASTQNFVEIFDALLDLQYVLDGAFVAMGLHKIKMEGYVEVHSSNMSKAGPDGKPIKDASGKVLKGPNYYKPNLYPILNKLRLSPNGNQK